MRGSYALPGQVRPALRLQVDSFPVTLLPPPTPLPEPASEIQFANRLIRTLLTMPSMIATVNRLDPP